MTKSTRPDRSSAGAIRSWSGLRVRVCSVPQCIDTNTNCAPASRAALASASMPFTPLTSYRFDLSHGAAAGVDTWSPTALCRVNEYDRCATLTPLTS